MQGNGVGHETQFGIIRKAALCAGHGHATVKLFTDLWDKKQWLVLRARFPVDVRLRRYRTLRRSRSSHAHTGCRVGSLSPAPKSFRGIFRVPVVYQSWANGLFFAFFAFNEISKLRAFGLGQNSDSPATTIFRYPFVTGNIIGFARVRRRIPVRALSRFLYLAHPLSSERRLPTKRHQAVGYCTCIRAWPFQRCAGMNQGELVSAPLPDASKVRLADTSCPE